MSKLGDALRAKYATPQDALRVLGLDSITPKLGKALRLKFRTPRNVVRALGLSPGVLEADDISSSKSKKDVVATDSKKEPSMATKQKVKLTRQGAIATLALAAILRPKLAQDETINLIPIVGGVTAAEFGSRKGEILRKIERACKGKLAKDTSLGEVAEFLDMLDQGQQGGEGGHEEDLDEMPQELEKPVKEVGEKFAEPDKMDADPMEEVIHFLKGKLDEEDLKTVMGMLKHGGGDAYDEDENLKGEEKLKELGAADDEDGAETEQEHRDNSNEWRRGSMKGTATDEDEEEGKVKPDGNVAKDKLPRPGGKMAGDRKYVTVDEMKAAMQVTKDEARKAEREIREAERFVQPWVGNLQMVFDSAEEVYRKTLKIMGVRGTERVHPSALRFLIEQQPQPGARRTSSGGGGSRQAADSASNVLSFEERYPDAKRISLT
jgi:DNA-binding transcriptional MerR regulator